ncbi:uncharacterized protein LOC127285838 isoform X2 [Leptopilina boulardi]|uniref:uncharacterized protein LOC127285838 isoform X2 n=1 Tax=Leptopilina boulardi TaxID=63433 RepID=UPI0021F55D83|nr:uncharacterized protein LOC127285838 isoform X2 [Leptopilina boulardi]
MRRNLRRMKFLAFKCFLIIVVTTKHGISSVNDVSRKRKIIIDTDAGGDDAVGILLALKYESAEREIEIIAITCTYGNTNISNVEVNIQKILTIAGRNDIPIYSGAHKPLIKKWAPTHYFGEDGMNDFKFNETITVKINKSQHAATAMADLVKTYPGEVTIIALGPTTNIALAISLDPEFITNVGQLVVMGSTITGWGNISPGVDFNFGSDPDSNSILMESTKKPIILVPREVSLSSPMYLKWRKIILGNINSSSINFLNKAENIFQETKNLYWSSADPRTVAIALWPNDIVNTNYLKLQIIPIREGEGRGGILVERNIKELKSFNALTAITMNVEKFQKILIQYLSIN